VSVSASAADLVSETAGAAAANGVEVVDAADSTGAAPPGGAPVAVAELTIGAARSTSPWVTTYDAAQVVVARGVSALAGQLTGPRPGRASATVTPVRVTLPVLVTRNE
jgi:hypothetical protein